MGAECPADHPSIEAAGVRVESVSFYASRAGGVPTGPSAPSRRWGRLFAGAGTPREAFTPGGSAGWHLVEGDDAARSPRLEDARREWRGILGRGLAAVPYEDPEFPAAPRSISGSGAATSSSAGRTPSGGAPPRCRCGTPSAKSNVRKEGPTKDRPYWHCATRRCGFFTWADAEARRDASMWWQRFPEFVIVSDFGFRAEDLRQGGVGDCWFMSALAVVAERPDLVLRLFGGETARNAAGCYQIQLFLDGCWQAVLVDDRLPCTDQQRRPDGTSIAYSRADGQQLWSALVEKAYAKAHGSYRAISGGEISEALLDLTGCPTESIDFDEHGFDPQELWQRLQMFKGKEFPMGCATVGNPELREVGLCGNHAYSILDIREIFDPRFAGRPEGYGGAREDGVVRLLRIRNPHGVGEWNGEWSDRSAEWTDGLAAVLGRTGVDDGTFWMDYTHFLMAFQVVDVCMAHRGWHSQSFETAFCTRASGSRLCKHMYRVRCEQATTLYAMALQPTKRGSWCREDRKKSYKPGDISLLLFRLKDDGTVDEVVGGNFFGADVMARRAIQASLEPRAEYLLAAFCFGTGPTAHGGDARGSAPFRVRLFASQPPRVQQVQADQAPQMAAVATGALHRACLTLAPAPGRRFRRLVRRLASDVVVFQVAGEGITLLLVANRHKTAPVVVSVAADVKVMTARGAEGLLASQEQPKAQEAVCFNCGQAGHFASACPNPKRAGIRPQWRYPAKWRRVATTCSVPAGSQRLALVLLCNGMQAELGSIELELRGDCGAERRGGLERWMPAAGGRPEPAAAAAAWQADAFEPRPLLPELLDAACRAAPRAEDVLEATREASLAIARMEEEWQLQQALAASGVPPGSAAPVPLDEDQQLQQALAASRDGPGGAALVLDEEQQLQQALAASRCGNGGAAALLLDEEQQLQQALAASSCGLSVDPRGAALGLGDGRQLREMLAASSRHGLAGAPQGVAPGFGDEERHLALALEASVKSQESEQSTRLEAALWATSTCSAGAVEIVDSESDVEMGPAPGECPERKRPKVVCAG